MGHEVDRIHISQFFEKKSSLKVNGDLCPIWSKIATPYIS